MDSIWQNYGYEGDSVWVWGIESTYKPDSSVLLFQQTYGATFPGFSIIGQDSVLSLFDIGYTPQYVVICPDKSMKKVSVDIIEPRINSCAPLTSKIETDESNFTIFINNFGGLQIENINSREKPLEIKLYNIYGQPLLKKLFVDDSNIIINNLPKNSLIIVCISAEGKYLTKKLIFNPL